MERNKELDFLKGFLIIMVVFGHTTAAFGQYERDSFLNYCNSFTVSFIMPLFLIITGYLLRNPLKNIDSKWYLRKFKRLCIPAILWGGGAGTITLLIDLVSEHRAIEIGLIRSIIQSLKTFWYLYATFISAVVIGLINQYVKGIFGDILLIIIGLAIYVVPSDIFWIQFAYGFILVGYFIRKYNGCRSLLKLKSHKGVLYLLCLIYLVALCWFKYDYSMYVSGLNLITNNEFRYQLLVNIYRFIMGVLGSLFVFFTMNNFYKYVKTKSGSTRIIDFVESIGINSLEMYVTQYVIVERVFYFFMNNVFVQFNNSITRSPYSCYFLWRHLFGLCLVVVTYIVCKILKSTFLGKLIY